MMFKGKNVDVLAEEFKQRAFDGKWQRWVKIPDEDNAYSCVNEAGNRYTTMPEMWVVTDVYDYMMEIVD